VASIEKKNHTYLLRFRFGDKEYKRSLKTQDKDDATAALHEVESLFASARPRLGQNSRGS
jgi:hypothetical protein